MVFYIWLSKKHIKNKDKLDSNEASNMTPNVCTYMMPNVLCATGTLEWGVKGFGGSGGIRDLQEFSDFLGRWNTGTWDSNTGLSSSCFIRMTIQIWRLSWEVQKVEKYQKRNQTYLLKSHSKNNIIREKRDIRKVRRYRGDPDIGKNMIFWPHLNPIFPYFL